MDVKRLYAVNDEGLVAVLHDMTSLVYAHGGLADEDVPAHVRAASAIRRQGDRLVIVQDDVSVLAVHSEAGAEAILLPANEGVRTFDKQRGNKQAKMDLEACARLPDDRLVAFGSGSTRARERLVVLGHDGLRTVHGAELYQQLASDKAFCGSELNIEGAVVIDDVLRLFQRGNGAVVDDVLPVNATCDLSLAEFLAWLDRGARLPTTRNVTQYDLGRIGEVAFTFTDAALLGDGRIAFLACAEASPDTYRDGEVLGCLFGIAAGDQVRSTAVRGPHGQSMTVKLEGIELRPGQDLSFDVVADMDRPDQPAMLGRLVVTERNCT